MFYDKRPGCDLTVPQCQPFDFPGDDHGVLLIHGFTGSCAHMRLVGEHLRDQGFTVSGINLPGHATSLEDMKRQSWQTWKSAAEEALARLRGRCRYVSVAGLSMGGCLTLILTSQGGLTACAPISAPMAVQNRFLPLAKPASLVMPVIWWKGDDTRQNILDPAYDRGYSGFPTAKGADLSRLIRMAREKLEGIDCPILIVQSHADQTIAPESAEVIYQGVRSTEKEILWLEDVPHACTASRQHAAIIARELGRTFRAAQERRATTDTSFTP